MKSDISIPNPLFQSAQQLAENLGISLSDFYMAALSDYVISHEKGNVTEILNQVYETEPSEIEPELVTIQMISVGGDSW